MIKNKHDDLRATIILPDGSTVKRMIQHSGQFINPYVMVKGIRYDVEWVRRDGDNKDPFLNNVYKCV